MGFLLVLLLTMIWNGPDHTAFGSPDEALTAHAIRQVVETGAPLVRPPISDPEGLFASRLWTSIDERAIPTHTPFLFYMYAAFMRLGPAGSWILFVYPALGLAALVAGTWLLLPRHRWLSLAVPGLAFPLTFRFLKPWENMAAMVATLALVYLAYVLWHRSGRRLWAYTAICLVAIAASIRPDQLHLVFGLSLIWTMTMTKGPERLWLAVLHAFTAFAVVAIFLIENSFVTGDPLLPPVYLLEGQPDTEIAGKNLPPGVAHVVSLLFPKGWPQWSLLVAQVKKYWWALGPVAWVTAGALASLLAWPTRARRSRMFGAAIGSLGLLAFYVATRVNATDWGADQAVPSLGHSLPRYAAISFGVAAVGVCVGVVAIRSVALRGLAIVTVLFVSTAGLAYLYDGELRASVSYAARSADAWNRYAAAVDAGVEPDALLYVRFTDKYVWDVRPTAVLPTEPGTAKERLRYADLVASLARAADAGFVPYVFELRPEEAERLTTQLRARGLTLQEWTTTDEANRKLSAWKVAAA